METSQFRSDECPIMCTVIHRLVLDPISMEITLRAIVHLPGSGMGLNSCSLNSCGAFLG